MKQRFLVSDESNNSHGFILKTDGIDTSKFELNPVMLWMHERTKVIGRWENIKKENGKLYADAVFDLEDDLGREISRKVEKGFLKATSVGVSVDEQSDNTVSKSTLYEISIVDIGSNSNALKLYNKQDVQQLYMNLNINQMNLKNQLITVLGIENTSDDDKVIKEVKSLLDVKKSYLKLKNNQIDELIKLNLSNGKIKSGMEDKFRKLLQNDFEGTKEIIESLSPRVSIYSMIKNTGVTSKELDKKKNKTEWTLEDYRKYAPNELRDNKQLYKELLAKEGIINQE